MSTILKLTLPIYWTPKHISIQLTCLQYD